MMKFLSWVLDAITIIIVIALFLGGFIMFGLAVSNVTQPQPKPLYKYKQERMIFINELSR